MRLTSFRIMLAMAGELPHLPGFVLLVVYQLAPAVVGNRLLAAGTLAGLIVIVIDNQDQDSSGDEPIS